MTFSKYLLSFFLLACFTSQAHAQPCGLIDVEIRGSSMMPLYKDGDHVDAMTPQCLGRKIGRSDIVVFKSGAADIPLIKRIVALPGDRFTLKDNHLMVNDVPVSNSQGQAFYFSEATSGMISLYESQFKTVLPDGVYLVMGDHEGVIDSSRLGPLSLSDILYVAVAPRQSASVTKE